VNKQAILAEFKGNPHVVSGIPGITIESGVEYFSVSPFEIEVPE
jgi:phage host-nuclease inhibitor protein Gam